MYIQVLKVKAPLGKSTWKHHKEINLHVEYRNSHILHPMIWGETLKRIVIQTTNRFSFFSNDQKGSSSIIFLSIFPYVFQKDKKIILGILDMIHNFCSTISLWDPNFVIYSFRHVIRQPSASRPSRVCYSSSPNKLLIWM